MTKILFSLLFILFLQSNAYAQKILILGDSLTEGYGIKKELAYPALLEKKLRADGFPKAEVINAGVSGSTTASGPGRFDWLMKQKPDVTLLVLGANDGLRGLNLAEAKKNLIKVIEKAKKEKVKIILVGMELPPNYGGQYPKDFRQMFADVAKEQKIPLLPFLLLNVGGISKLNLPDGIHPNEEGHKIVAETVFVFLKGQLKK